MWDFVVVGAGPAGSRFARRAAECGSAVVVFERGTIGTPLACSGHVSDDLWRFTPPGSRVALRQHEIRGARFHVGGPDSTAYPFYKQHRISNVIDRVALDRRLADAAVTAGADVRTEHTVTEVTEFADHVAVTVSTPDGVETVRARMVVGCDGPVSRVRRELGLPEPGEILHGVLGFDETPDYDPFVDVHLTVPSFFAWRIPRGEAGVEYGLAMAAGADVRERFAAFTDGYGVDIGRRCSGAIPIGPPPSVTSHRGFLIGDAAAQTKPFTGGGIIYGMTAADLAATTIDPGDPASLSAYEASWRAELGREITLGAGIRRAYDLPAPLQQVGLATTAGEIGVHMDRPSTVFSRAHLRASLRR